MADKYFTYKGFPLVRSKNFLYFGNPGDEYIVFLQINDTDKDGIPTKVSVSLLLTDESLPPMQRVKNSAEKPGLFAALDIGLVWLTRALKK